MNDSSMMNSPFPLYRDFSQTITSVFEFTRDHYRELLKIMSVVIFPASIVYGIIVSLLPIEPLYILVRIITISDVEAIIPFVVSIFLSLFISALTASVTTIYCAYIHRNGRFPESLTILLKGVLSRLPSYFGVSIISTFILFFSALIFLVPALYFIVPLTLAYAVYEFENLGVVRSVDKAISYVKGDWWSTMVVMALPLVILLIIPPLQLLQAFASVLMSWYSGNSYEKYVFVFDPQRIESFTYVRNVLSMLLYSTLEMLMFIAAVFRYFSLKAIKEGTFLNTEIDLLGSDNSELR